jgi:hypothetical protein
VLRTSKDLTRALGTKVSVANGDKQRIGLVLDDTGKLVHRDMNGSLNELPSTLAWSPARYSSCMAEALTLVRVRY